MWSGGGRRTGGSAQPHHHVGSQGRTCPLPKLKSPSWLESSSMARNREWMRFALSTLSLWMCRDCHRIQPLVQPGIQEEQCGFCPRRGTLEQLYILHGVMEGPSELAKPVDMCFVDLQKAFNHVPRDVLRRVPQEYGVLGPLLRAVWSPYARNRSLLPHCKSCS